MSCLSLSFQCITVQLAGFQLKMFVGVLPPYPVLFGFVLNFLFLVFSLNWDSDFYYDRLGGFGLGFFFSFFFFFFVLYRAGH